MESGGELFSMTPEVAWTFMESVAEIERATPSQSTCDGHTSCISDDVVLQEQLQQLVSLMQQQQAQSVQLVAALASLAERNEEGKLSEQQSLEFNMVSSSHAGIAVEPSHADDHIHCTTLDDQDMNDGVHVRQEGNLMHFYFDDEDESEEEEFKEDEKTDGHIHDEEDLRESKDMMMDFIEPEPHPPSHSAMQPLPLPFEEKSPPDSSITIQGSLPNTIIIPTSLAFVENHLDSYSHQNKFNSLFYFDDYIWNNFVDGQVCPHVTDTTYLPYITGTNLKEICWVVSVGHKASSGGKILAEERKEQIEQLPPPLNIRDPPFDHGVFFPVV